MSSGDDQGRDTDAPPTPPDTPHERAIRDLLHQVGRGEAGPDPQTSARMRARLMAAISAPDPDAGAAGTAAAGRGGPGEGGDTGAPGRVVPDGGAAPRTGRRRAPAGTRRARAARAERTGRSARSGPDGRRPGRRGRLVARTAGALSVALLAGLVLVALGRDALPGEALYGVKRVSESAELALATGQEARARRHLQLAEVRLGEVSGLLGHAAPAGSGPSAAGAPSELVVETLADFEDETREGVRLFLPLTTNPSGPSPTVLAGWARAQTDHLDALAPSLLGASRPALDSSRALLGRVTTRADELATPAGCPRTATDEWGPVPTCAPGAVVGPAVPGGAPATPVDPSSSTTTPDEVTTDPDATGEDTTAPAAPAAPARPSASVRAPAPVLPGVPRLPTVDPPRLPAAPRVPDLPPVDLPPVVPGLPRLGGG